MKTDSRALLAQIFENLKISVDDRILSDLESYAAEVVRWNRKVNLTGAKSVAEFVCGPLFDALCLLPVLETSGSLVDVGSGGGLPGIPVALVFRDCQVTLVEPRTKRVAFLNHVCHQLGLSMEILHQRAEELGSRCWRGAVAQAVWSPEEWIPRGKELVEPGGAVYVLSTGPVDETAVPRGLSVAGGVEILRPFDNAPRHSTKIVVRDR